MSDIEIRIPDIGDAKDVEVIEICVTTGDEVNINDALIVIESDKASMEVPSTVSGSIRSIAVEIGDLVNTDDLVVTIESSEQPIVESPEAETLPVHESDREEDELAKVRKSEPEVATDERSAVASGESTTAATGHQVEVHVPDLDGTEGVVVIEILVSPRDKVDVGDPLIVLESDKASMEIPTPVAGVVDSIHLALEDEVKSDSLIARITTWEIELLSVSEPSPPPLAVDKNVETTVTLPSERPSSAALIYAGPAVRRLARELGVDLGTVKGSGAKGRIVKDDVKAFVKGRMTEPSAVLEAAVVAILPDFEEFGEIERVALSRTRRAGATNLSKSWSQVVHVTQHDEADATELEQFRRQSNEETSSSDIRLTALPFVVKCCVQVLRQLPQLNSSVDLSNGMLVLKRYYHIGIAVDTEEGLVVPVIRNAEQKGIRAIAAEISELSDLARNRRLRPDQVSGASFTISNLGRVGGTGFTPIVNWPEVAILGVGRLNTKPVWDGESFVPRAMLPLSLSYDHRAINGVEAGQFVQELVRHLSDIRRILL